MVGSAHPTFGLIVVGSAHPTFGLIKRLVWLGLEGQFGWLGLLCGVRMFGSGVDFELGEHGATELVFGKHTADGFGENHLGLLRLAIFGRDGALACVAGVPSVFFLLPLLAREADFLDVDDDDIVACVDVGRVGGAMLAHEDGGNLARESTDDFFASVDEQPFLLDAAGLGHVGFHLCVRPIEGLTRSLFDPSRLLSSSEGGRLPPIENHPIYRAEGCSARVEVRAKPQPGTGLGIWGFGRLLAVRRGRAGLAASSELGLVGEEDKAPEQQKTAYGGRYDP